MNKPMSTWQKIAIGLAWMVIIFMGWFLYSSTKDTSPSISRPVTVETKTYSDVEAYTEAQEILRKYLKSPSTADFPTTRYATIERLQDNGFQISSYVDAQNSFGAMLRSDWMVIFQYVGNHLEIYGVVLDGQTLYKRDTSE